MHLKNFFIQNSNTDTKITLNAYGVVSYPKTFIRDFDESHSQTEGITMLTNCTIVY